MKVWGTSNVERRTSNIECRCRVRGSRGFTLIEVVISSALMAMVVVTAYLCFSASVNAQKLTEPRLEVIQNARVAMAMMTADLRSACPLDQNSSSQFIGMQRTVGDIEGDNLDFATHNYTPRHSKESDFCEESFYVNRDPETGSFSLWRRRNPTIALDPLSGGTKEEIAKGVAGLRFEYFDGLDWYDSWGDPQGAGQRRAGQTRAQSSNRDLPNLNGMPTAVRITLYLDPDPPKKKDPNSTEERKPGLPLVFQTIVQLNLAAAGDAATAGTGTTTDTGAGGQTQTQPGTGGGGGR